MVAQAMPRMRTIAPRNRRDGPWVRETVRVFLNAYAFNVRAIESIQMSFASEDVEGDPEMTKSVFTMTLPVTSKLTTVTALTTARSATTPAAVTTRTTEMKMQSGPDVVARLVAPNSCWMACSVIARALSSAV